MDYLFDLDEQLYGELTQFARRVAKSIKKVCPCRKVGVAVLGLEVPHAHIHLIPLQNEGDMNFHNHVKLTEEEFKQLAAELAANFE